MFCRDEAPEVYKALVAELAYSVVPTTIMGLTILIVGLFAGTTCPSLTFSVPALVGGVGSAVKVFVMLRHTRRNAKGGMCLFVAKRWERAHAIVTYVIATSVGGLAMALIAHPGQHLQVLGTALVFGYSSGIASRICIRPWIAAPAITIAAAPPTLAALIYGDAAQWLLATIFLVFMVGGIQSVCHVYQGAVRQIGLRLQMADYARRDMLTGLANRRSLQEAFDGFASGSAPYVAVYCFDLDGFKAINDGIGHFAGDVLLVDLGARLNRLMTESDVAARVGGDEFIVFQPRIADPRQADDLAQTIFSALTESYDVGGQTVTVGVSLGYTVAAGPEADFDRMVAVADAASYRVKRRGGGIEADVPARATVETQCAAA